MDGPENDLIPDAVLDRNAIEFKVDEVTSIDREGRTVETAGGNDRLRTPYSRYRLGADRSLYPRGGQEE